MYKNQVLALFYLNTYPKKLQIYGLYGLLLCIANELSNGTSSRVSLAVIFCYKIKLEFF